MMVIFTMLTSATFLGMIAVIISGSGAKSDVGVTMNSSEECGKSVVCNCNFHVHEHADSSVVIAEMKELKAKMEQLIAIVNSTTLLKPTTAPGKLNQSYFQEEGVLATTHCAFYNTRGTTFTNFFIIISKGFQFLRARNNTKETSKAKVK